MKKFNRLFGTLAACAALLLSITACSNSFTPQTPPAQPQNGGVSYSPEALATPLTLKAAEAGAGVTFVNKAAGPVTYKVNGGEAQTIASGATRTITLAKVGDKVEFFGDNKAYATSESNYSNIYCDKDCYVYGNIMSLVQSEGFKDATELKQSYAFFSLFSSIISSNTHIKNKSGADLLLPATTLADYCYNGMFSGCTSLTAAPSLPATTLAKSCYSYMFSGCTSLTAAPSLPAATLAQRCYDSMFSGCTSLTAAPSLPATTLANYCYRSMFSGCASLTAAPSLPATTLADYCYNGMFSGCTSLTAAPSLNATTLAKECYSSMFSGCTSLTAAPSLPAATLANSCYRHMFDGCTSLTAAPELPAATLAPACYMQMFYGCTSLTAAPSLPATTLADYCYGAMFYGCASLTAAPSLPAATLAKECYKHMFYGCTSLASVTCLATNISADNCTKDWLKNVAASGTFTKADGMASWPTGSASGIPSGWTVRDSPYFVPLTLEACVDGAVVTFINRAAGPVTYKVNGGAAQTIASGATGTITLENIEDKVEFFGDNKTYATDFDNYSHIACSADCYIYGNIMSLVKSVGFASETTLEVGYTFCQLFDGDAHIKNKTGADLLLPATTLADYCYAYIFSGCTSLTAAPSLPATTLAEGCYSAMFSGCTSLNSVTCLATDISAKDCTKDWLKDIAANGTFTKAKNTDWSGKTGADGIPSGWTVVDKQ